MDSDIARTLAPRAGASPSTNNKKSDFLHFQSLLCGQRARTAHDAKHGLG